MKRISLSFWAKNILSLSKDAARTLRQAQRPSSADSSCTRRMRRGIAGVAPWIAFALFILWGWRVSDLAHSLPAYDDVLEVTWITTWYDGVLRGAHPASLYPLLFYPTGWRVATYAGGPALLLALLPLNWLGGPAFAYNVLTLLTLALSFAGIRAVARRLVGELPATVAALLYTFWGFHWFRIAGHMNVLIAAGLLPWMLWSLERSAEPVRRPAAWLALAGLLWALMITSSWYFLWMGAVLLGGGWLTRYAAGPSTSSGRAVAEPVEASIGSPSTRPDGQSGRAAHVLRSLFLPPAIALLLCGPALLHFVRESNAAGAAYYDIAHVASWDASLNSFPVPNVTHPWLGNFARALYRGPTNEPGQANFGLLASLLAVLAIRPAARDRRWWPVLAITVIGLILSLGLTLKWDGQTVRWEALRGLNNALWRLGYWLKPDFFPAPHPLPPFDTAVPLPGLLLSILVPFWERARVFARYALLASVGVYLLTALSLARVRHVWARGLLAALLIIELLPPPSSNVPFPPAEHPAFAWLRQHASAAQGIVDLDAWQPDRLYLPHRGQTLLATQFHQQPTVAGASSILPAHVAFLDQWLAAHPHPFATAEFAPLWRYTGVRYILFHVSGGYAQALLGEAAQNPDLQDRGCFDPPPGISPWDYPMCILELLPWPVPDFNILPQASWSDAEAWGRWVEGAAGRGIWMAPQRVPYRLRLEIFPLCDASRPQHLALEVNGVTLATHAWQGCELWSAEIEIPAQRIEIGWNELVLRSAYAVRPVDLTGGQNGDARWLSVGVRRLEVAPILDPSPD